MDWFLRKVESFSKMFSKFFLLNTDMGLGSGQEPPGLTTKMFPKISLWVIFGIVQLFLVEVS